METFLKIISQLLATELEMNKEEIYCSLQFTPDGKFGDIAFPCFVLSARLKKSPSQSASELESKLSPPPEITEIRAEGPYLNFKVKPDSLIKEVLGTIHREQSDYGCSDECSGQTVVMDYSSPNIAKPFGIGHLRSTVIGHSLIRIYRSQGYKAIGINHIGDWGTQFGKLIYAFSQWGDSGRLAANPIGELFELYVRFHREAEANPELERGGRECFRKLEEGDQYAVNLWKQFHLYSTAEFDRVYKRLGISFDYQTGESFYNDKMPGVIEELKAKNLTKLSQDALVVDLEQYGMPPCLLKKKDEATLYATRDLAAAIYRFKEFAFDKLLYIVGAEQKLHFQQLFKVIELMGYGWVANCLHVDFGRIKFEGEEMSTRKGNIIVLEEVLDESQRLALRIIEDKNPDIENREQVAEDIGLGAVIFAQFSSRRGKNISFSWDEALNFDGQTGPYLQYTHARISSLERKYGKDIQANIDPALLSDQAEIKLCKQLGQFPLAINTAMRENEPFIIACYLLLLASEFNGYYQRVRVLVEDKSLAEARMFLVSAVRITLRNGLYLLGIKAPVKM
ncbi:MAG: arginine--tRNA ligase [candidate division Zixibacteria bacterium CG_4_9_14_3_um_filter_46_8]|nr:MAG: arginine--tRNA ligase [candidate division Zixibacteria bacterium CG_4_9_14_3_um_filter_46_8]